MACSCQKHTKSDLEVGNRSVNIPHAVRPGESCIFCAEKHVSVAYSIQLAERVRPVTRQIIIGELECARRHTYAEYSSECATITAALRAFVLRDQEATDILAEAQKSVTQTAARLKQGEDSSGNTEFEPVDGMDIEAHPLIGELYFCSAFRLAFECGYTVVNRPMLIGDLSLAQVHLHKFNYGLAERIRDIRHRLQRSEVNGMGKDWIILAQNIDVAITPNIESILNKYGKDLSWFFEN